MRRAQFLSHIKSASYPTHCIWYDTETIPEEVNENEERHRLSFGWACYRRYLNADHWSRPQWHRFTTGCDFWEWAQSKTQRKASLWLYAHNAAYDATVTECWRILPQAGWSLSNAVIDSPPFIAYWRRDSSTLRMLDTLNLWKVPLAVIGKVIGLEKYPMPESLEGSSEADRYCKRDVEIIMKALIEWWYWLEQHDLGGNAATLASQAFTAFRHRFLTHSILIDNNPSALQLARDAYHGGRVEVFRVGETRGPLYLLDVRSEYPSVMQSEDYPTVLRGIYGGLSAAELADLMESYAVVALVDIDTSEPVFPYSDSSPLLFPIGTFRTTLTTGELATAIENDALVSCLRVAVYDRAPIFRNYVTELSGLRSDAIKRGDPFAAWVLKHLLNNLYGKFGQRGRKSKRIATTKDLSVKVWDEIDGETGERYRMRQLAGVIEQHWIEGESALSHPAIAAHVTGYGRRLLWSLIRRAGQANVLYCDTDSVLVNQVGYDRLKPLLHGDKLGSLHLDKIVQTAVLRCPKDYRLDDVQRIKGVRSNAVWIDDNTVLQEKWVGLRSLIMRGDISTPVVRREVKHLTRRYNKGTVLRGGRVRPYRLPAEAGAWLG